MFADIFTSVSEFSVLQMRRWRRKKRRKRRQRIEVSKRGLRG